MVDAKTQGHELAWDDEIDQDGGSFELLEAGNYPFRVQNLERARYAGGSKLPPCNQIKLMLDVGNEEVATTIQHNLFLHTQTAGFVGTFFRSIGQRKHGEKIKMDWSKVVGATGACKVGVRTWKGKDGEDRQNNEIKAFLDPETPKGEAKDTGERPF